VAPAARIQVIRELAASAGGGDGRVVACERDTTIKKRNASAASIDG
jgi:hypothetical protein